MSTHYVTRRALRERHGRRGYWQGWRAFGWGLLTFAIITASGVVSFSAIYFGAGALMRAAGD